MTLNTEKETIERTYYQSALNSNVRVYFYPPVSKNDPITKNNWAYADVVLTSAAANHPHRPEQDKHVLTVWGKPQEKRLNDHVLFVKAEQEQPLDDLTALEVMHQSLVYFNTNADNIEVLPTASTEDSYPQHTSQLQHVVKTLTIMN